MKQVNLVIKFQLGNDPETHVVGASRIGLDGCGGLVIYHSQNEAPETVRVEDLQSFSILPITAPARTFAVASAA